MIILEGIDGTGKTAIANFLENKGMKKFHYDYDPSNCDLESKYLKPILNYNDNYIMDRSFISELVYGPVIRKNYKGICKQECIYHISYCRKKHFTKKEKR